jgi:hypothetical protein
MSTVLTGNETTWVGKEAPRTSTFEEAVFPETLLHSNGDERRRQELLDRLARRSSTQDGLDRNALLRLNIDAWGIEE